MSEDFKNWLAKHVAALLPRRVVYHAAIRVGAEATTGEYGFVIVPDLTFMDAIGVWGGEIDPLAMAGRYR